MAQRIFIPTFKQAYVLAEDATFLMYPFNSNATSAGLDSTILYAKYYKATGFEHRYESRILEYTDDRTNEAYQIVHNSYDYKGLERFNREYDAFYVVTDTEFPQAVVDMMQTPQDLLKLGIGKVYIETSTSLNWINDSYTVFVKPVPYAEKYERYHRGTNMAQREKPGKFVKELPTLSAEYLTGIRQHGLLAWEDAQVLNPQVDKMIERNIPIYHTISKGSSFMITEGIRPYNKKYRVLVANINEGKYTITTDQLHNFLLEEVMEPTPTTKKGKKK